MCGVKGIDCIQIGEDDAFEVPRLAQHLFDEPGVGGTRHSVDAVVGCHHRTCTPLAHCHLKGRQVVMYQTVGAHIGVGGIMSPFGNAVGCQMFQGGHHMLLHAFDHGGA